MNIPPQAIDQSPKLVIVMVGLPARGKSYITKKISRYLNWLQHDAAIFNVGDRRRKMVPAAASGREAVRSEGAADQFGSHMASFFDPDNPEAQRMRENVAMQTLDELLDYLLLDCGTVALFDATNSTHTRRELILERTKARKASNLSLLFIESQCCDEQVSQNPQGC
jgi:6-phosphofructo-2-kinase